MTATQNRNTYLEQVVAQQERLEQDLRVHRAPAMPAAVAAPAPRPPSAPAPPGLTESLPEIVAQLPQQAELRAVTIGGHDGTTVAGLVAELGAIVSALRSATE